MSKFTKILCICFALLLCLMPICMATDTAVPTSDDSQPINLSFVHSDLYLSNQNVVLEDDVEGNVFVYGQTVTIKGQILGDLFVAANDLIIDENANVSGNLFAFANNISIVGNVNNVYAFSQSFVMEDNATIARDLRLYSKDFHLKGTIQRDAHIASDKIVLEPSKRGLILGDLHYTSSEELQIEEGAVLGKTEFTPIDNEQLTTGAIISNYIAKFIRVLVYSLVVILLAVFVAPNFANKATYCMEKKPFITAGVGILAFVLVPVISVLFMITGFLSYVGMALLVLYILMISITIAVLGMAVGNYLVSKLKTKTKGKMIGLSIISVAVIWLLQIIPVIGSWISIFTYVFGFGILLCSIFRKKQID